MVSLMWIRMNAIHNERTIIICRFDNVRWCILTMDEIEAKHKNLLALFDEQRPQITRLK